MSDSVGFASELAQMIEGDVCNSEHPDYETEAKRVWNACLYVKKPLLFVKVANENDILETLKFCTKNKLPLCICNGGTSMFAQEDGAVVIILTMMNKITVDPKSKQVAEVECGATQGDLDKTTAKYHLATPLGQASYVGVTGSGLLLGMGLLGRQYGYTIDNIHTLEMITASGEILKISAIQNQELFWAMKGYGFNFGIVTKLWLNLHLIPAQVMAGNLCFTWEKAADVLKLIRDFLEEKNDDRLVLYGVISIKKESDKSVIFLRYFFNGELDRGQVLLDDFCKRTSPYSCDVNPTSYDAFQKSVDKLHPFGNYYFDDKGGFFYKELSDEVIDVLVHSYTRLSSVEKMSGTACYVVPLGGAYGRVPRDSSPFQFREARYYITNVGSTPDPDFQSDVIAWLDETSRKLSTNAMKTDESANDQVWQRLREVKRQYDPQNTFRYNINIDPS